MNKLKQWLIAGGVLTCVVVPVSLANTGGVKSLRGDKEIDSTLNAPELKRQSGDTDVLERNYVQQPPLIPHRIQGYKIDLRSNKCLLCHSWKNAKRSGATKISMTHFKDRDGNELSEVAPRRYFCVQCHVPQVNAQPLVKNQFEPVKSLQ
ncbi:MAG: nitrate reductase cytochrome c-type subunit [Gammaproteobacteria bacterium]|nr:nitrate reductase cytochrome c-type subunit [Gammaproteobacteria bacterium]MDH5802085.1 nitrate reductase cytochrome c-type subunit [Gammaproteobacteria bacterium]